MQSLEGKVALVTGATRGAGRGIAVSLGEAGAEVWCTGRSVRGVTPEGRPETIEETAELVTAAGGQGRWLQVDHTQPEQVQALCERIDHLDILVNDIWGGDELTDWGKPLWEHDLDRGLRLLQLAVTTHLITSKFALPLMIDRPGSVVVEITDGIGDHYRGSVFYDLAKASTIRLGFAMASELESLGILSVAITPGFLRSEAVLEHLEVDESNWQTTHDPHFAQSETPRFVGRGIAALCADPDKMRWSGQALSSGQLGRVYDLQDIDGRRPDFGTFAREATLEALARAEGFDDAATLVDGAGPIAGPFIEQAGRRMLDALLALDDPHDVTALAQVVQRYVALG